ncbi:MAG: glycine cleavage system protein GcvH [Halieaceae bacterium]|jgi:glycine cleavage system H protein
MSLHPETLCYADTHEWARREEDGTVTVGITDHAQQALGDVVYVELPSVGAVLSAGAQTGIVESVKAASDIYAPVSGTVVAINEALVDAPEQINEDPYDKGWFYKLMPEDLQQLDTLLSAAAYEAMNASAS